MIVLAATGGTVAGKTGEKGTYAAAQGASGLLAALGPGFADVQTRDVFSRLSFEITLDEWLELIVLLQGWLDDDVVEGIVVTQGTALLEEVPYLASLFIGATKPVVFTGSMMPLSRPGSDAVINMIDAIKVARDPHAGRYGPLVVMGRQVFDPARVIKAHKSSPATLEAVGAGLLGEVDAGGVHWLGGPPHRPCRFDRPALAAPVALIKAGLGMDASDLAAALDRPLRAAVIEGFPGGGGVPADWAEPLMAAATTLPVILTSRALDGRIGASAGGRSGGGTLLAGGLIDGGAIAPARARLLAMASLANSASPDPVRAVREDFARANSMDFQGQQQ